MSCSFDNLRNSSSFGWLSERSGCSDLSGGCFKSMDSPDQISPKPSVPESDLRLHRAPDPKPDPGRAMVALHQSAQLRRSLLRDTEPTHPARAARALVAPSPSVNPNAKFGTGRLHLLLPDRVGDRHDEGVLINAQRDRVGTQSSAGRACPRDFGSDFRYLRIRFSGVQEFPK